MAPGFFFCGPTEAQMSRRMKEIQLAGFLLIVGAAAAVVSFAQSGTGQNGAPLPQADPSAPVPAYHTAPPKSPLPDPVSPDRYTDPISKNSYAMAAKVRNVLYQQPCYCYCDRNEGHHSLYEAVKKRASDRYLDSSIPTYHPSLNACRFAMFPCVLDHLAGAGARARPSRIHCCTL